MTEAQDQFYKSRSLFRAFCGGIGCGKSWIGSFDLASRAGEISERLYMVCAPTYPMLRDASLRSFLALAREYSLLRAFRRSDMVAELHNGTEVLFRTADDPDRLRGPNLSGIWLDEAGIMAREAFDICIGRLREGGEQGWLSTTFTPKGKKHWTYEVFGQQVPDTALFHARTKDNPFLPPSFEETVRRQYTEAFAAQELGGEFIDPIGAIFNTSRVRIVEASPIHARRVRYWDKAGTAGGGDYSAGVLLARAGDGVFHVEDVVRGQWSAGQRNAIIRQTAEGDALRFRNAGGVAVWVEQEPGSGGKESAEITIRELAGFNVHAERVTGEKTTRAMPYAAQVEAGNVHLVRGPWNTDYLDELNSFPEGRHDDMVDASSGAFAKLVAGGMGGLPTTAPAEETVVGSLPADTWR